MSTEQCSDLFMHTTTLYPLFYFAFSTIPSFVHAYLQSTNSPQAYPQSQKYT